MGFTRKVKHHRVMEDLKRRNTGGVNPLCLRLKPRCCFELQNDIHCGVFQVSKLTSATVNLRFCVCLRTSRSDASSVVPGAALMQ